MKRKVILALIWSILILTLSACGSNSFSSQKNASDISGEYRFGDNYTVNIWKNEPSSGYDYYFSVVFDLTSNDCINGNMNLGEAYHFDDSNSFDNGQLKFSLKKGKLSISIQSEVHGDFNEELSVVEKVDYTNLDWSEYNGDYYSPTEAYGINLYYYDDENEESEKSIYVLLDYAWGDHDEGEVIFGEETTLANGATITLTPQSDGSLHIRLYSSMTANGNYEEDLIRGNLFDNIGITPSMLGRMSFEDAFSHLCEIENNCRNMDAATVTGNPSVYCDGKIYRFPGEVVWCGDYKFLLKITDDLENNLIVCYPGENVWVSEGDKICVYGTGNGTDSYNRTFSDGTVRNYTTLAINAGYVLYQSDQYYNFTESLDIYPDIQNFICGNYELKSSSSNPTLLEKTLTIDNSTINGRPYTIENVYIDFAVESLTTSLSDHVYLKFNVHTPSKRSVYEDAPTEYPMTFQFALDGSSCNYGCMWKVDSTNIGFDTASYVKVS